MRCIIIYFDVNFNKILLVITIFGVIGIGGLYIYADSEVTIAINSVADSLEYMDSRLEDFSLFPTSATYVYVYRLENPSNIDVTFTYYAEIYFEEQYVSTLEFEILVPAKRSVTVETEEHIGKEAFEMLQGLSEIEYHYIGSFTGEGKFLIFTIKKTWSNEWDWLATQ